MSLVVAFTTKCNSITIAFNVKFLMSKERGDTRHMTFPVEVESGSGCAIHNLLANIVLTGVGCQIFLNQCSQTREIQRYLTTSQQLCIRFQ